jgi:hypothetical protein
LLIPHAYVVACAEPPNAAATASEARTAAIRPNALGRPVLAAMLVKIGTNAGGLHP